LARSIPAKAKAEQSVKGGMGVSAQRSVQLTLAMDLTNGLDK